MYNKIPVSFKYGQNVGMFFVWQTKGGKWQWEALGNNGEEATMDKAIAAGRNWIKFDTNKQGD